MDTWTALLFGLCFIWCKAYRLSPGATNSYILAPGKVLPGPIPPDSFKVTQNLTLTQCAAECSLEFHLNQFHCYAFEYVIPTKMCVLTNVTTLVLKGGYLGLLPNPHMNYYERSKGHYINLFQPYQNQYLEDQSTYFAVFHNMTLEKCALFCLLETRDTCMSFSHSDKKQACGLSKVFYSKDNGQTLVVNDGGYSHYQYFTTWPCNATIPWNYSPRAIASPYFPYASVKDVNCYVKIEAPVGKQVDLQFSTFFTESDICVTADSGISVYDGDSPQTHAMSRLCSSDNFVNRRFQSSSGYLYVHYATGNNPMAFKAVYDFIEIDPCRGAPCQNEATCVPATGNFFCACAPGYTGTLCETNIDDCANSPCYMGGQCIDLVNDFTCQCPRLLGGRLCDEFVGLCYLNPCKNGGSCSPRGANAYLCSCVVGFTGQNCSSPVPNPCQDHPCQNGATCNPDLARGSYTCTCQGGFDGARCESNIDDCASNPCLHNIPCTDLINDYRCECPSFMGGKKCQAFVGKCHEQPCQHGKCVPTGRDNYTCICNQSYTGMHCDSLFINYCDPSPCKHGHCASFPDGPSCNCDFGYEGFLCDQKINYCENVKCIHGACETTEVDFHCNCIPGYDGRFCNETINHCATADCHGGFCINTVTSHFCVCKNGHTSIDCAPAVDHCGSLVCKNGTCLEHGDDVTSCQCFADYTGEECDVIVDYCVGKPCLHGICTSTSGTYKCICEDNFTGTNCDTAIDHCKINQCVYGFCQSKDNGFECICVQGYHGNLCQYRPGEIVTSYLTSSTRATTIMTNSATCPKLTCRHGTCDEDFANVCLCHTGFSGQFCDVFAGCNRHNPCFHGNCSDLDDGYVCTCESGYHGNDCDMYDVCTNDPCKYGTCVAIGDNHFRCTLIPLIGTSNTSQATFPFWFDYGLNST